MNILVTGGAGYIGSHAVLRLLRERHRVTVIDDLSRGHRRAIELLEPFGDLHFAEGDLGDRGLVALLLRERSIEVIMHFGALAYVGESEQHPLRYYRNNTAQAIKLIESMAIAGVKRFVFSSTCATYGTPDAIPIAESCPQCPINPYGRSKLMVEHVLADHAAARKRAGEDFAYATLRYFNVAGCDAGGLIGEHHVPETHLIPVCLETALGQRGAITVFGTGYDTPDGTCIRDYVHVDDIVDAHVAVMNALSDGDAHAFNIGIGRGYSVREVIEACRRVTKMELKTIDGAPRAGDPPMLYADASRIERELGWKASRTALDEIIETAWQWRQAHPHGYGV